MLLSVARRRLEHSGRTSGIERARPFLRAIATPQALLWLLLPAWGVVGWSYALVVNEASLSGSLPVVKIRATSIIRGLQVQILPA